MVKAARLTFAQGQEYINLADLKLIEKPCSTIFSEFCRLPNYLSALKIPDSLEALSGHCVAFFHTP